MPSAKGDFLFLFLIFLKALYKALQLYKSFKKALKQYNLSEEACLYREFAENEILPWNNIDIGVTSEYFKEELIKAKQGLKTIECFEGCKRCGVCD